VSKFDAIHKKAAAKTESIVDYQERLDAKKRQAASISTPLVGGAKRPKIVHGAGPSASPAAVPFTLPHSSPTAAFTVGVRAAVVATPGIAKRTRSSLKKESARKPGMASALKPSVAKVAQKKVSKKPVAKAPEARTLFSSKIPVRSAPVAPVAPSVPQTTFTQIACLEDLPKSVAPKQPHKKFDLSASLAKPLTWKPHKGKIAKDATKDKENAMDTSDSAAPAKQPEAFVFEFTNAFTAAPAVVSQAPTGLFVQKQPKAAARENIKNVKMGVDKESVLAVMCARVCMNESRVCRSTYRLPVVLCRLSVVRAKLHASTSNARNKAMAAARNAHKIIA
jgi:hypothetical protein